MVALKNVNEHEIERMLNWRHGEEMDLTLIETMSRARDRRAARFHKAADA
jgi:molybdenum cofactor biosynthesis enzyme MoaA